MTDGACRSWRKALISFPKRWNNSFGSLLGMMKLIKFLRRTRELQEVSLQNQRFNFENTSEYWSRHYCSSLIPFVLFPIVKGTGAISKPQYLGVSCHCIVEALPTSRYPHYAQRGIPRTLPQLLTPLSTTHPCNLTWDHTRSPLENQCLDALYEPCQCFFFFPCHWLC